MKKIILGRDLFFDFFLVIAFNVSGFLPVEWFSAINWPWWNSDLKMMKRNVLESRLGVERAFRILTKSVSRTPAARMYTVCENCWMTAPHTRPTMPNSVMMILDSFSALPWPSKSCWWEISLILVATNDVSNDVRKESQSTECFGYSAQRIADLSVMLTFSLLAYHVGRNWVEKSHDWFDNFREFYTVCSVQTECYSGRSHNFLYTRHLFIEFVCIRNRLGCCHSIETGVERQQLKCGEFRHNKKSFQLSSIHTVFQDQSFGWFFLKLSFWFLIFHEENFN